MGVSPWTEASKALVSAAFGDPAKRLELQKLDLAREQFDQQSALEQDKFGLDKQRFGLEQDKYGLDRDANPSKIEQAQAAALAGRAAAGSSDAETALKRLTLDSRRKRLGLGDELAPPSSGSVTPEQIAMVESNNNPNAVSPVGALGRMQVMPATAANPGFGVAPARDGSDAENMRVGTDYYNAMLKKYGGNEKMALAAYNAGPGRVDAGGPLPAETVDYVGKFPNASGGGIGDALSPEPQTQEQPRGIADILAEAMAQPAAVKSTEVAAPGTPSGRMTEQQIWEKANQEAALNADAAGIAVDQKDVNARIIGLMNLNKYPKQRIIDTSRELGMGVGTNLSIDQVLAQAGETERTPAQLGDLFEGKATPAVKTKTNIADILKPPPGKVYMGPAGPGEQLIPEPDTADKLFAGGVDKNDEGLMRMGNLMKQREIMNENMKETKINQQVKDYSKGADDFATFAPALTRLNQSLSKYPPGKDIPGFGETGGMFSMGLSKEGKEMRQDYMAVANGAVYLLSGKQINSEEGKRLAQQFGGSMENGTFSLDKQFTDDQLRKGIQGITRQLQNKLHNTGALLTPEALQEYQSRGGTMLPDFLDPTVAGFDQEEPPAPELPQSAIDAGIDPKDWEHMDEEGRALFQ